MAEKYGPQIPGMKVGLAVDVMVQDRTQVNTIVANAFQSMSFGSRVKQNQLIIDAPSLLIACGLAMRGVD